MLPVNHTTQHKQDNQKNNKNLTIFQSSEGVHMSARSC